MCHADEQPREWSLWERLTRRLLPTSAIDAYERDLNFYRLRLLKVHGRHREDREPEDIALFRDEAQAVADYYAGTSAEPHSYRVATDLLHELEVRDA